LVATRTTVSPGVMPMPLATFWGMMTCPFSKRADTPGDASTSRALIPGHTRGSLTGSTAVRRTFVDSTKLLSTAPSLRRGAKDSIPGVLSRMAAACWKFLGHVQVGGVVVEET
jgi:hypothetical protein